LLDDSGSVTSWNAGAGHLLGYTAAEITGEPFARLFTPEDARDGRPGKDLQTAAAAGAAGLDCWLLCKDGTKTRCRGTVTALRPAGGGPAFGVMFRKGEDVPGLAEQRLRERAEEVETLMEVLPVAVLIAHDPQARRVTGNRAAVALLGTAPDANLSM